MTCLRGSCINIENQIVLSPFGFTKEFPKTDCKTSLFKFINMLDTAKDPIFLIHKRSLSFAWLFGWPNSQLSRKCLSSKIKLAEQRIWKQYQGGSKYGRRTCGIFCENYYTRDILSLTRLNLSANLLDILRFACRLNIAQNLLAERRTEFTSKAWQRGSILNQLNVIFCSYIFCGENLGSCRSFLCNCELVE